MNDSKIIKAFECCVNTKDCGDCSLVFSNECKNIGKLNLDLIKRLQIEIDTMKDTMAKLLNTLERANKYGLDADERIEQLKIELETAKSEAVKGFAEKLKKFAVTERVRINQRRHVDVSYVRVYDIDRLLEETGCNDG